MSSDEIKKAAEKIFAYIERGELPENGFSNDFEAWTGASGVIPGEVYRQRASGLSAIFTDGPKFEILSTVVEGNNVVFRVKGKGTVITGAEYKNDYSFHVELDKDQKIRRIYEYMNVKAVEDTLLPAFVEQSKRKG